MQSLKNPLNFYVLIFAPLSVLMLLLKLDLVSSQFFAVAILVWALVYHPYISGNRLIAIGKINKQDLKYNFIPFWNLRFFDSLFFNR